MTNSNGVRVLVVDDCQDSADMLCTLLKIWGFEAQCAYGGLEALGKFGVFQPDGVLIDLGMPRLDGIALGERVRELPGGNDTTLIAVTGFNDEDHRLRCMLAGFDHFLAKPVDAQKLELLLDEAGLKAS